MIQEILREARGRMDTAVEAFKKEMASIRTGRASASMLDDVVVDAYGTSMPLNQVATLSTPEARLIVVQPWDKGTLEAVEKAIIAANLGLTPSNDGKIIRLPVPPLSEERRKDLVKQAKKRAEESKVGIRAIRRDAKELLEELEKEGESSKDDIHRAVEELQGLTDSHAARVDELTAVKEKEILEF
jgi:ribosome recycling factor